MVYLDVPNSAELLLSSVLVAFFGAVARSGFTCLLGCYAAISVFTANLVHDAYRHLYRDAHRTEAIRTTVAGPRWFVAVLESSLIRMFSEWGRVVGLLERGEWYLFLHRFDWFAGVYGDGPKQEERKNNLQRVTLSVLLFAMIFNVV